MAPGATHAPSLRRDGVTMCLMTACWGGRGPCALGGAPRRRREAAAHAAPDLPRGLDEGRARRRRLEVGLEEEVEERRRALEVHEEERRRELDLRGSSSAASPWNFDFYSRLYVERHPPADRGQLVERRQDEVEEQVLAGRGRLVIRTGVGRQQDGVERSDAQKRGRAPRGDEAGHGDDRRRDVGPLDARRHVEVVQRIVDFLSRELDRRRRPVGRRADSTGLGDEARLRSLRTRRVAAEAEVARARPGTSRSTRR